MFHGVQAFNQLDNDHRRHPEGDKFGILALAGVSVSWWPNSL